MTGDDNRNTHTEATRPGGTLMALGFVASAALALPMMLTGSDQRVVDASEDIAKIGFAAMVAGAAMKVISRGRS